MKRIMRIVMLLWLFAATACGTRVPDGAPTGTLPAITPDYVGVTVPRNIAPLTFSLADTVVATDVVAVFERGGEQVVVGASDCHVAIDIDDWRRLAEQGDSITVTVYAQKEGKWLRYDPFAIYLAPEPIDSHLAYRLIEPGYEVWSQMGIYQRDLTTYDEKAIITNELTNGGCMNCHSFCMQDPSKMLFHLRVDYPGTYVTKDGCPLERLDTKTGQTISALVYPSWHPAGRYVAFSTNDTKQMFHLMDPNRIEVFDYASDVVVYDTELHQIMTSPQLSSPTVYETFPTFSPDGRTLYYCAADSVMLPDGFDRVHYSLCSISFDPQDGTFGTRIDTLYDARAEGRSVSFPRVSPDGRWLAYTLHDYGNFSIWHHDADLYLLDLATGESRPLTEANSADTESYHSWSSNSRWLVFSSRRLDGLYTRPHFVYIDADGHAAKPFVMPQRDKDYYTFQMKSYNVPELITGPVTLSPSDIRTAISSDSIKVTMR